MSIEKEMYITGVQVNYFFICKRKLWLYCRGLTMEHNSDRVEVGKEVHANSYKREKKDILIDNIISIDFIENDLVINETKLTKAMDEASKYQLLYYIYYLEEKGVGNVKGIIRYPKSKRTEEVEINDKERKEISKILVAINYVKSQIEIPQLEKGSKCKKCSYFEFCYS